MVAGMQGARATRISSPSKIVERNRLQKSQRVAKLSNQFWSKMFPKRAKFMFFGSNTANMATLISLKK